MFSQCSALTSLDVRNFDTSNVKIMDGLFSNCSSLTELDLYSFNTLNCQGFNEIFTGVYNLVLIVKNSTAYNMIKEIPQNNNFTIIYMN